MKSEEAGNAVRNVAKIWSNYVRSCSSSEFKKMNLIKQGGITDKMPNAFTEPLHLKPDNINHPTHYNQGGIETLDYIKAKAPHYESYAIGNIIKYVSRYQHKNGLEDLKKAQFYLNDLVEEMEKNE